MVVGTVITVAYNSAERVTQLVRSIEATIDLPHKLIVVDNGSAVPIAGEVEPIMPDGSQLIRVSHNAGMSLAVNMALEHAEGEWFLFICGNGGLCVRKGWGLEVTQILKHWPQWGLAGAVGYHGYEVPPSFAREKMQYAPTFPHVQGGIMFMNPKMIEDIGGLCTLYPMIFNDVELANRAVCCDWKLVDLACVRSTSGDHETFTSAILQPEHAIIHHVEDMAERKKILVERLGFTFEETVAA